MKAANKGVTDAPGKSAEIVEAMKAMKAMEKKDMKLLLGGGGGGRAGRGQISTMAMLSNGILCLCKLLLGYTIVVPNSYPTRKREEKKYLKTPVLNVFSDQ